MIQEQLRKDLNTIEMHLADLEFCCIHDIFEQLRRITRASNKRV